MIQDTRFIKEIGKALMLGNEAVVRGCLESGVCFVAQYPSIPTSDIGSLFQQLLTTEYDFNDYLIHHWALNEAVASSECAGAAWTGSRVLNPMKHVGMNVASDALSVIALNGYSQEVYFMNATELALKEFGSNQQMNLIMLGFAILTDKIPFIEIEHYEEVIKEWLKEPDKNIKALTLGLQEGMKVINKY